MRRSGEGEKCRSERKKEESQHKRAERIGKNKVRGNMEEMKIAERGQDDGKWL